MEIDQLFTPNEGAQFIKPQISVQITNIQIALIVKKAFSGETKHWCDAALTGYGCAATASFAGVKIANGGKLNLVIKASECITTPVLLTKEGVLKGIVKWIERGHKSEFVVNQNAVYRLDNEAISCIDADEIIQLAVFDEVRYRNQARHAS